MKLPIVDKSALGIPDKVKLMCTHTSMRTVFIGVHSLAALIAMRMVEFIVCSFYAVQYLTFGRDVTRVITANKASAFPSPTSPITLHCQSQHTYHTHTRTHASQCVNYL